MPINLRLFFKEMADAGISGEGVSVGGDGSLSFRDDVETSRKQAIQALVTAHNPDAPAPPAPLSDIEQMVKDLLVFADAGQVQKDRDDAKARLVARFQGR